MPLRTVCIQPTASDAAEAVCGFPDIDMLDVAGMLGSLVDKSLVVAEPAGEPCATGCWRPSACQLLSGWLPS